ncbi:tripartite tricarboxylate transporter substrate-binding protein [Teichococcus vastitatis]|uniref:Tripartite tricarboxylate transporter substrate binding protein n=1 Tax=Teichococcus vastitatis TaxID=2307076 RepID=A0ABS9WAL0_9PROT|nr:tripartite tricarboxylate transporter substrate-binding protein [Pseudoroseomonas vastitatis]MCI0755634.1 tripartite tricarboxylate transporter substrate binding protein [Pseudoroseomonas vastitatis]
MIQASLTRRGALALGGALALRVDGATAQALPRTVRLIVPYPPGGASDITARLLAQELSGALEPSFVVENRGGAASITGTQAIATAQPDAATLGVVDTAFLVNPGLFGTRLPYDTRRDFTFVSMLVRSPLVLVVPAQSPWKNVAELMQAAKDRPGELAFGSAGNGSAVHMAGEQLRLAADFTYVHVPYRGGGPMITDLLAARVQMAFGTVPAMAEHVRAGRLRALAVTGGTRAPLMPDVPSMVEVGQPRVDAALMNGLVGPAGLAVSTVETLSRAVRQVLTGVTMRARLAELGFEPVASAPEEFRERGLREIAQWEDVVRRSGIQPE